MDVKHFDQSVEALDGSSGRRKALGAISAAGMALLAALGLADGGEAKKKHGSDKKARNREFSRCAPTA
jgi:hypothetical protein